MCIWGEGVVSELQLQSCQTIWFLLHPKFSNCLSYQPWVILQSPVCNINQLTSSHALKGHYQMQRPEYISNKKGSGAWWPEKGDWKDLYFLSLSCNLRWVTSISVSSCRFSDLDLSGLDFKLLDTQAVALPIHNPGKIFSMLKFGPLQVQVSPEGTLLFCRQDEPRGIPVVSVYFQNYYYSSAIPKWSSVRSICMKGIAQVLDFFYYYYFFFWSKNSHICNVSSYLMGREG